MKNVRLVRVFLPLLAALALLDLPSAPSAHAQSEPSPAARVKVRLAINLSPISALPLIADSRGLFKQHGLDVTISPFSSGRQALETVLGGGAEIATAAESPVTAATFANQRIALLARMEYSELRTLLHGSNVQQAADLRGKRIGYTAGTGSEVYTHELLKRVGLQKSDVTLVNLRPQDMIAATAAGSIDAYNIWEPFISNGKKALGAKARVLDIKNVYTETFNVVTTEDYAKQNPKVAVAFLRALYDAEQWLKSDREAAITLVAERVGMKRDELAAVWNEYIFELALDDLTLRALNNHAQWRIDSGNAAGGAKQLPDFRKLLFSEPLKQVAPQRVRL